MNCFPRDQSFVFNVSRPGYNSAVVACSGCFIVIVEGKVLGCVRLTVFRNRNTWNIS